MIDLFIKLSLENEFLFSLVKKTLGIIEMAEWQEWDFGACPWCGNFHYDNNTGNEIGHAKNCKRQQIISELKDILEKKQ